MVSDIVDGRYTIVTKECNHRRLQLGLAEEWGGGGESNRLDILGVVA